jgi:hypothetical protein
VLTRVDLHDKIIQPQIDGLKKRLFGHTPATPVILHRRELVRKDGAFKVLRDANVELDFNSNILKMFHDLPYLVNTVQIDKKAHLDAYTTWHYDPYHYCARCLIERYVGNYMVDKARLLELELSRQAGADDLKTYFPELKVPFGVTWHDLEVAEQMVFDWENGGDYRAFGLAIKIYECLRAAVLAAE